MQKSINVKESDKGEGLQAIYLAGGWCAAQEILKEVKDQDDITHITVLGAGIYIFYPTTDNVPELAISLDLLRAGVQYIEDLSNGERQDQTEG